MAEEEASWFGVVTYVTDGDTLWVRPEADGASCKLRLDGMDAPEIYRTYGPATREALVQRLLRPGSAMQRVALCRVCLAPLANRACRVTRHIHFTPLHAARV